MLAAILRPPAIALAVMLATAGCEMVFLAGTGLIGLRTLATRPTEILAHDGRIRTRINAALQREVPENYPTLGSQVFEGRVLLTGTSPSDEDAQRAAEVVSNVEGVQEVYNEIQIGAPGGLASYASDVTVANAIRLKLAEMNEFKQSVDSELEVVNGVAYLIGVAPDEATIGRVAEIIRRVNGVERVVLHLRIKGSSA